MTTMLMWTILLSFYLLFALLLTRYVDHRPLRAAGLTLNRRALFSLLTGTGISVGILGCIKAVFLILGAGEFVNPLKGDPTAMPLWLMIVYALGLCYVSQAIGEEAVMRGYLLQSFSDRPKRAVWISVVVFTIPHLISRGGQQGVADHLLYLALPFGFAVTAAYLSLTMRSVWAGIGIHGGFHLCNNLLVPMNPSSPPPVMWVVTGLAFSAVGLLIASRISQERWAEIAERGVAVSLDGGVEGDVVAGVADQVDDLVLGQIQLVGDLTHLRFAAEGALQVAAYRGDLVDLFGHVHGEAHDTALLGDAAGNGLPHPPGGIGGKLESLGVVELLHRPDQAGVALLHQVEQRHLSAAVFPGHGDHQAQVRLDETLHGLLTELDELLQFFTGGVCRGGLIAVEDFLGEQSGLDGTGQLHLLLGAQQRGLGYRVQVEPNGILAIDTVGAAGSRSHDHWVRLSDVYAHLNASRRAKVPAIVTQSLSQGYLRPWYDVRCGEARARDGDFP